MWRKVIESCGAGGRVGVGEGRDVALLVVAGGEAAPD
jgi:hypothetical protein